MRQRASGALSVGASLAVLLAVFSPPAGDTEVIKAFWPTVAWIVGGIVLAYIAGRFLMPEPNGFVADDRPTVLATRGSPLPRLIGKRRIPYVFGWAGDRSKKKESGGKKGGGGQPEQEIFYEAGWHLLCLGPGSQLIEIEQGGKSIFTGPITPVTHPSGSTIDLGGEGSFRVYWGEESQPIDAFLADPSRVGIASRWPGVLHIVWISKRLGPSPHWPQMTYVVEVLPKDTTHLTQSPFFIPSENFTLTGPLFFVQDVVNGVEGTGHFELHGGVVGHYFVPGGKVRLTNNGGLPDQDFDLFTVTQVMEAGILVTRLYPVGGLSGADPDGEIQSYKDDGSSGINPAHALADLWFTKAPWGLAQDKALFDMAAFEALGELFEAEGIKGSFLGSGAIELKKWLESIHADLGIILPFDRTTGRLKYFAIREPVAPLPHLTEDMQVGQLPEIANMLGARPTDRVVWSFPDRANRYRTMTIALDDAGQATYAEFFRASTEEIVSTTEFDVADKIAQRRELGDFGVAGALDLNSNRKARLLLPGTAFTADGFEEVLRVVSVQSQPLSSQVTLKCVPDIYGAPASEFVTEPPEIPDPGLAVAPDLRFQPIEVPEFLNPGGPQRVLVARIRAHVQIDGAIQHISRDDVTYSAQGQDTSIMAGGVLLDGLAADELWEIDQGPRFTAEGPDINSVLDLSADTVSWRRGRQIAVINGELFFLKKVTSLGGSTYRLDGLIRARYDTRPAAHLIGAEVYILQDDDGLPFEDVLLEPEVDLYVKSQAIGNGVWPLSLIAPEQLNLYGKGVRPMPVSEIRFNTLPDQAGVSHRSWQPTGGTDDLPITWGYFTPRSTGTGAGFFGAGVPTVPATPEGSFLVEILDSLDVVKRTETVATNAYSYTEENRLADFSAVEPNSFKVRVTQLRGGLLSDPVTETFTKVS